MTIPISDKSIQELHKSFNFSVSLLSSSNISRVPPLSTVSLSPLGTSLHAYAHHLLLHHSEHPLTTYLHHRGLRTDATPNTLKSRWTPSGSVTKMRGNALYCTGEECCLSLFLIYGKLVPMVHSCPFAQKWWVKVFTILCFQWHLTYGQPRTLQNSPELYTWPW